MHTSSAHVHSRSLTLTLMQAVLGGVVLLALFAPVAASYAQELRIADDVPVTISEPERSTAYYGKLQGETETYIINASEPFLLFLTILVPRVPGAATDVVAEVIDTRNPVAPLAVLDGDEIEWQNFTERAGGDEYLAGPAFRATVPEGTYEVRVSRPGNEGPYVLIVGEERSFSFMETLNTYNVLPRIKSEFFNEPAYTAFTTRLLVWPTVVFLAIVALVAALYWTLIRRRT